MNKMFLVPKISRITDDSFELSSPDKITLKDKSCCIILFHDTSEKSSIIFDIFKDVSSQISGPRFMSCDLQSNSGIASELTSCSYTPNSPNSWINISNLPIILVYRQGFPVSCYNGSLDVSSFAFFCSKNACNSSYQDKRCAMMDLITAAAVSSFDENLVEE